MPNTCSGCWMYRSGNATRCTGSICMLVLMTCNCRPGTGSHQWWPTNHCTSMDSHWPLCNLGFWKVYVRVARVGSHVQYQCPLYCCWRLSSLCSGHFHCGTALAKKLMHPSASLLAVHDNSYLVFGGLLWGGLHHTLGGR